MNSTGPRDEKLGDFELILVRERLVSGTLKGIKRTQQHLIKLVDGR